MPGIWGDGQRGGIFGTKVNPLLVAELERRAVEKRQMARGLEAAAPAPSTIGSRAAEWWNNSTLARMADPRTSPLGPAAIARMFYDPAGEAGRQVETGRQLAAPFTQFNDPNVDPVKQGADLAMTVMGGSSVVPAEANSLRMGIKAYHGSPHDFEAFDASKIGTGEGAQAYGHGLYVAENEAVAKAYKDVGPASRAQYDEINNRMSELARVMGSDAVPGKGRVFKSDVGRKAAEEYDALMQKRENLGHMYEVDIAAEPEQFLDWDKPLSEQSPKVREALASRLPQSRPSDEIRAEIDALNSESQDLPLYSQRMTELMQERAQLERELAASGLQRDWLTGAKAYDLIGGGIHGQTDATNALREAGIPGIRYLDQGSRNAQGWHITPPDQTVAGRWMVKSNDYNSKGMHFDTKEEAEAALAEKIAGQTRNYVVFPGNEHLISILRKYGLPISAAGLAALSQLHPQEAQAAQKQKGKR